ncbi:hypothetical protein J437_LFUL009154 [Ladona fulva]|uniref:Uncharacterized protein n=1 Tax=Ladona fulva TaxID=123851 RepID=A0A8K0KMH9_LADFU|nr:hypothetical protein J437_LFUL009154 [Ladona fulva]
MRQARWMPRAIYSLKISLLSDQFKITSKDKAALILSSHGSNVFWAVKAPYQDLCSLKSMKAYKEIDKSIAKEALQKIRQHLF